MPKGKNQPGKFIGFFNLIEAMKRPGCPACICILEETQRTMDGFLYESVNDPRLRDQIRKDGGFCHRHSWQLAQFGDALGGAILFRDLLQTHPLKTGAKKSIFSGSRTRHDSNMTGHRCLFCRRERQSHGGVVLQLVQFIRDAQLVAAWDGPALLCLRHLADVCADLKTDADRDYLIDLHRAKYQRTCEQMSSLIQKQSYDHHPGEISAAEKDSWRRAVEILVGRFGLQ